MHYDRVSLFAGIVKYAVLYVCVFVPDVVSFSFSGEWIATVGFLSVL
jgi:hypothetical protein